MLWKSPSQARHVPGPLLTEAFLGLGFRIFGVDGLGVQGVWGA